MGNRSSRLEGEERLGRKAQISLVAQLDSVDFPTDEKLLGL
jgi:hypothetical protein